MLRGSQEIAVNAVTLVGSLVVLPDGFFSFRELIGFSPTGRDASPRRANATVDTAFTEAACIALSSEIPLLAEKCETDRFQCESRADGFVRRR